MAFDHCMVWPWSCSTQFRPSLPSSFTVLQTHLFCVLAHSRCRVPSAWNALSLVHYPSGQGLNVSISGQRFLTLQTQSGPGDLHSPCPITSDTSTSWFSSETLILIPLNLYFRGDWDTGRVVCLPWTLYLKSKVRLPSRCQQEPGLILA